MKRAPIRRKPKPDPISRETRDQLHQRSGGFCEVRAARFCKTWASEAHHRKLRRHGDHRLLNLLNVCRPCHRWVHQHPKISYATGWLVESSWYDPADVPVVELLAIR